MKVIQTELEFRGKARRRSITRGIVLEMLHMQPATPQRIHTIHLERGWRGAAYHYLIRRDGSVYALRPRDETAACCGTHAKKGQPGYANNREVIAVCLEGDGWETGMEAVQKKAAKALIKALKALYPTIGYICRAENMPGRSKKAINI